MNRNLYSQDNIEAYLTNRLDGAKKLEFENGLAKDPLLQNEVNLQSEIISSLKETRRLELKHRLNNIEVPSGSVSYFKYQIAASVIAVMTIIGSLFYFNSSENQNDNTTATINNVEVPAQIQEEEVVVPQDIAVNENANKPEYIEKPETTTPALKNKIAPVSRKRNVNKIEKQQVAVATSPELKSDFDEDDIHKDNSLVVPQGQVVESSNDLHSEVEVSIKPQGENSFHYQFYNNKLFLYCDFNAQPYELIELNKRNSKLLYLNFNNTYYELKNNQVDITPLKAIRNQELIKQLNSMKHK